MVKRVEETVSASKVTNDLEVTEESGSVTITWEGRGGVRGFILHRTEKGKNNYTPITGLISYFGKDNQDVCLFRFTDNTSKPEFNYNYRLDRVEGDDKHEDQPSYNLLRLWN